MGLVASGANLVIGGYNFKSYPLASRGGGGLDVVFDHQWPMTSSVMPM